MKQTNQLVPMPVLRMKGDAHKPLFAKGQHGADWYRIENKKGEDKGPAKIYIYDEIGFWGTSAANFIKELGEVETDKLDLHLNSPGGEIFDGIAIYNSLKMHNAEVTVYIDALAASAASFIAQAGDKVVMARNATMMIHDGIGICFGNADDMRETGTVLDRMSNNIADIYAQRAGGTVDDWRAMMKAETWYTGKEAVDANLADELTGDTAEDEPTDRWDLSIFNYAGRQAAPSPDVVREKVITNRATEALVGKTTNPAEGQPATAATPEVPAEVPAVIPEVAPVVPPVQNVTVSPATPVVTTGTGANGTATFTFMLGGKEETDPMKVQSYVTSLETFRNETRENARKEFINGLARDNKILASQIPDLEKFVDTLSDEQYELWMASWGAASPSAVLQTPAVSPANSGPAVPGQPVVNKDEEIEKYKGIVKQHKLSNMPVEAIKKTDSYNRLIQLVPDFTL